MSDADESPAGGQVIALRPAGEPSEGEAAAPAPKPAPVPAADPGEPGKRRPIIPAELGRDRWRQTLREWTGETCYRCAYHGVRAPWYPLWFSLLAGRGGWRLVKRLARWWSAPELKILELAGVAKGVHHEAMRAHEVGKKTRKQRGQIVGVIAFLAAASLLAAGLLAPWWAWLPAGAAGYPVLVYHGKPEGRPILRSAIVPPQYSVPTPEIITRAFDSLGISKIGQRIKDKGTLDWVSDVHRDGPGWAVELDLPHGVTAKMIVSKRAELSSGLRRPLSAVWPEAIPGEHEARLYLWIGRQDMARMKPPPWPLLKSGTADYFQPAPFAFTPRGAAVLEKLFGKNWLIGGAPGNGKTGAVRVLAAWAALDPTVQLWVHELLGKGDLDPFRQVAYRYCSGLDPESLEYAAQSLAMLRREVQRRTGILKKIPLSERPDGDITREIAARYGLTPIVAVFDEIHNLFLDDDLGSRAADDISHVIRSARALGITVIAATQRPDKDSMPTTMSGIVTTRFCLKVPDWQSNDMILGTGSNNAGWSAVAFRQETDAGLGWLRGTGDPRPVKTYYLNLPATQKICARARTIREAAGTLSGYALGDEPAPDEPRDLLADVLDLYGPAETFLYRDTVAGRLAERRPGAYSAVTADSVADMLKPHAPTDDGREPGGKVLKGWKRQTIEAAITARDVPPAAPDPAPDAAPAAEAELLGIAAEVVIRTQYATTAMLQRKLNVSHEECNRIMNALLLAGIVGHSDGAGQWPVLRPESEAQEWAERLKGAVGAQS